LRFAHQANLLGFGLAGLLDVVGFAFAFGAALFGTAAGDFDADDSLA